MNSIQTLIIVIYNFTMLSILCFTFKRKKELEVESTVINLNRQATAYFVTICGKLLTKYGDETISNNYVTFRILGSRLLIFDVQIPYKEKPKAKILRIIDFKGEVLVDQETSRVYSYSGFECFLSNFLRNSFVYDSYIKELWQEIQKASIQ